MSAAPSVSYSITVRLEVPAGGQAVSQLTTAVESAGGSVTALDVTASGHERLRMDVTIAARDTDHADQLVEAMRSVLGVVIGKASDRTFLMHLGGKIEMASKHPIRSRYDLSMIYTPGVARVCLAIARNPDDARRLTVKRNSIAVVTDGSAVLGLGNIGPSAALPVMEGKAALFKRFAGIDAWPLCLDTQDVNEIVSVVRAIAPGFAGINLEDISAPRCFEVERRLQERRPVLSYSRWRTPNRKSTLRMRPGLQQWWPPDGRTSPTKSTTSWPFPVCSGACLMLSPTGSLLRCCLQGRGPWHR
jgi:malate dehydrogenase (oxaloacetate-decarboxylating)